jgi:hypothetical protein
MKRRAPGSGHPRSAPASRTPLQSERPISEPSLDLAAALALLMRRSILVTGLGAALALGPSTARADSTYEMTLRTTDMLVGGTVELEERIVVSVKGGRLRQEATGIRAVVTRRGARYEKPGHRVTLEQLDHGRRFEINLDAATYDEETFADARQQRETQLAAAEKALGIAPREATPSLPVSVDRTGERLSVHGRECERVVLRSTREVVVVGGRGAPRTAAGPSRFAMTFDLCLAPDAPLAEAQALEARIADLTGARGSLQDRQLRVFERRRDVFAVFELMHRLLEREQDRLGGVALRWEWVFSGPRRDEPQATLVRQRGEITRIESGSLDASAFELPSGLTRDPRSAGR